MEERFTRNLGALTELEIEHLNSKRVCVVGCGGLGGYAIEFLARIGIGGLTVVDGDRFVLSNLNRQLLSSEDNLGQSKALAAYDRVRSVNSAVQVNAITAFLTKESAALILKNHDIVIDALDNITSRRILAYACSELGIPLVHGAISGWCAQIAVIAPNTRALDRIYSGENTIQVPSSLSFTPALAASIQVSEAVKILVGRETSLKSKILIVNLLTQEYNTFEL